jgi:hypothetical protein
MFIVLLNMVVISVILGICIFLTIVAIGLIIGSLIRAAIAKKNNKKTKKIGLWIGIFMLVIPWVLFGVLYVASLFSDNKNNRWIPDREVLATAVTEKDADDIYDLMADYIIEEEDISVEDIEEFFASCDIENVSRSDIQRYSEFSSEGNHYRNYNSDENGRTQTCFQYRMYDVNDEGGSIYISGVDGDPEGEEFVGIYYIEYDSNGEWISIGQTPPPDH